MDLQQLKAVGTNTSDNVVVQTLDEAGRTVDSYIWNDWAAATPCWVDDTFTPVEGVSYAAGQGLWIQGLSAEQSIQTAGAVGTADVVVALRPGFTAAGNPFPVALDLQDLVAEGADTSDNVVVQTLDEAGRTVDSYIWNDWAAATPCWVDDTFTMVDGVTIIPGAGLWIQGLSADQFVRFPAPTL